MTRSRVWKNRAFEAAMLFAMFVAFGTLASCSSTPSSRVARARSRSSSPTPPSTRPGGGRSSAGDPRDALPRPARPPALGADRRSSRRSTSRSTRPERWWNRLIEVNIQNLAAVPSIVYGILGLAFIVRGIGVGRVVLAGWPHPDARRAADRRRRLARGDPRRARLDPARRLRARRDEVAGRLAPGAPGRDPRHGDRLDPRPLARGGRDGAADHGRARSSTSPSTRRSSARTPRCRCRSTTGRSSPTRPSRPSPPRARSCCS